MEKTVPTSLNCRVDKNHKCEDGSTTCGFFCKTFCPAQASKANGNQKLPPMAMGVRLGGAGTLH